jgi:3-hydroxybutyryl-CoA dehydrogenase
MTVAGINTVCFVGAGTMGAANSLVAAASGYNTVIYDMSQESLAAVPQNHEEMGGYLVSIGFCSAQHLSDSASRIRVETDLARALAEADLVSESVVEVLEVKREVHARIDALAPERAIQTTNTSGFLVSEIEDVVKRGDRFAALHSHLGSPLIDIVPGPRTDAAVLSLLSRYVETLQCVPLVLQRENRGYVLNAMLGPVITAAMLLVAEGISTRDEVDRAWMKYRRATMGPFGMMDLFGLNVVYDGWQQRRSDPIANAIKAKIMPMLERYLERGELGVKTGKGFYRYPQPDFAQAAFADGGGDLEPADAMMTAALMRNAALLAARGVASPDEIDRAWMIGMNLDQGPFGIMRDMGLAAAREQVLGRPGFLIPAEADLIDSFFEQAGANDHADA